MKTESDSALGGETTHDRASERTGEISAKLSTLDNKIAIYENVITECRNLLAITPDTLRATVAEKARTSRAKARLARTEGMLKRAEYRRLILISEEAAKGGELARLEKMARDLRTGLSNLHALRPVPHDLDWRLNEHGAKLRDVEAKLYRMKQGRLL